MPIFKQTQFAKNLESRWNNLKQQIGTVINPVAPKIVSPLAEPQIKAPEDFIPRYNPAPDYPLLPEIKNKWGENYPYKKEIQKTWQGVHPNQVANVLFRESSLNPTVAHINSNPWGRTTDMSSLKREQWKSLRNQESSIDIGLPQLNTSEAMNNYLTSKGITYYDLASNPEAQLQIAHDLYSGKIPKTASGWGNWVATKKLKQEGYKY
jgi:hypothetical protein